jgi:hypothetical protein
MTLSITTNDTTVKKFQLSVVTKPIVLSVIMLNVVRMNVVAPVTF